MQVQCIIIAGPTGVGKTEFANQLGIVIDGEIINGDLGQMYVPLTIGTAKPAWRTASVPHHLFDMLTTPTLFSAMAFRTRVQATCAAIWQRKKIPIIVGGSSYYVAALFFPPAAHATPITKGTYEQRDVWKELHAIDPERARAIDPHDRYRIERALDIWYSTGVKPSQYTPQYDPIASRYIFVWLERDRQDLYHRIDKRVEAMIEHGWVQEVRALLGTQWQEFLLKKKIIGYPEVIAYCKGTLSLQAMITTIQKKTRHYAKRQITFWRMLRAKLEKNSTLQKNKGQMIKELNLTHAPIDRYIKQLQLLIND